MIKLRLNLGLCAFGVYLLWSHVAQAQLTEQQQSLWNEVRKEWQQIRTDILRSKIEGSFTVNDYSRAPFKPREYRVQYCFGKAGQKVELCPVDSKTPDEVYVVNKSHYFSLTRAGGQVNDADLSFTGYEENPKERPLGSVVWPPLNPLLAAVCIMETRCVGSAEFLESQFFTPTKIEPLDATRIRFTATPKVGIGPHRDAKRIEMEVTIDVNPEKRFRIEHWRSTTPMFTMEGTHEFGDGLNGLIPTKVEVTSTAMKLLRRKKVFQFTPPKISAVTKRAFKPEHYGLSPPRIQTASFGQRYPWVMGLISSGCAAVALLLHAKRRRMAHG